jgi:hypothetical protein
MRDTSCACSSTSHHTQQRHKVACFFWRQRFAARKCMHAVSRAARLSWWQVRLHMQSSCPCCFRKRMNTSWRYSTSTQTSWQTEAHITWGAPLYAAMPITENHAAHAGMMLCRYPVNLEHNYQALNCLSKFSLNNLGDPFIESNYRLHSRKFEVSSRACYIMCLCADMRPFLPPCAKVPICSVLRAAVSPCAPTCCMCAPCLRCALYLRV